MTATPGKPGTSAFLLNTIDLNPHSVPKKPGAYLRISDDPLGLERGVERQKDDAVKKQQQLTWGPIADTAWYVENDTSAYKKKRIVLGDGSVAWRNVRPVFTAMMTDLANGVIDGVIVYDQDRLLRQPRDLEDLIDLCERLRFPVAGVTGMIDLLSSNGRFAARMMAAVAIKSSEDTSRRVARSAVADAERGTTIKGGPRRFGWDEDATTLRPDEVAVILELRDRTIAGESRGALAMDLQVRGIPSSTGAKWTGTTVNALLRNPRLAGIRAYGGIFHGKDRPNINEWWKRTVRVDGEYVIGEWKPVMTVAEWEALQHFMDGRQPNRRTGNNGHGRGNPKHLLTGLVACGACGTPMVGRVMAGRAVYGCRPKDLGGCNSVSRNLKKLDALILELAVRKLEAADLTTAATRPKAASALAARKVEAQQIEQRKAEAKAEWQAGRYPSKDYFEDVAAFNARLEELRGLEAAEGSAIALPPRRVMIDELRKLDTPTSRKRILLSELLTQVLVNKSSRGPHFTPSDIVPVWRPELAE